MYSIHLFEVSVFKPNGDSQMWACSTARFCSESAYLNNTRGEDALWTWHSFSASLALPSLVPPFCCKALRKNALWPDRKTAMRKHSPCKRVLRIWNLLPSLVLNLSALICHALRSRMVIQTWPCTWLQTATSAISAITKVTLLVCFFPLDILQAIPAGTVISCNIINANLPKWSGTENHVLFQ